MWDLKVEDFPRFKPDEHSFEKEVLARLAKQGVCFKHTRVLDIGCGTGVYTIHLGKEAREVVGLDFSTSMLDVLVTDATAHNVHTIKPVRADFSTFEAREKSFDWVFCSMTPALLDDVAYEKAFGLADKGVAYLGWGGKRESAVLAALFEAHGKELGAPPGSRKLLAWLEKQGMPYQKTHLETTWHKVATLEGAMRAEGWHLKMHGIEPDESVLQEVLTQFMGKDGKIHQAIDVGLDLIVCHTKEQCNEPN
jgi:SAM-dependent methyltransferase